MLDKTYTPADHEPAVAARWRDADCFHAEAPEASSRPPFSIVIPPPNVTAALHMGHALNNTIQDILTRVHRMKGHPTLWMPGTDHAGIATQSVVDKRLQAEGKPALKEHKQMELDGEPGRERFVEKIQAWKDQYEQVITNQLKAMGCSCDWDRQRFTMDDVCARAVREAFFQLFKDGLIYRGKRLVNWDPVSQTALSDDEVEMEDIDGNFYYMNYPIVRHKAATGGRGPDAWEATGEHVTVATTRPETMLGDTAVAVNPKDSERATYIGQYVKLPIVGRVIPIVGDDYVVVPDADSDDSKARMASGYLKVTPAHDPNDYDIGQRHGLAAINVMAPDASISKDHGWDDWDACDTAAIEPLLGLSREDARTAIVKWFKANDLMAEVRPYRHAVGHSYRSHVPVEPYLSDQWYVKVTDDRLAGAALRAMAQRSDPGNAATGGRGPDADADPNAEPRPPVAALPQGELRFTPERYAKTFQTWHENIRDWCISRQLWWGHRIPVWGKSKFESGWIKSFADQYSAIEATISPLVESGRIAKMPRQDVVEIAGSEMTESALAMTSFYAVRHEDDEDAIQTLEDIGFEQDPDVLDTWFSSALWPLSTMGWPGGLPGEGDALLDAFNPTSVLCTAREIITLWVSRMVMFNTYFHGGKLPFEDVYIHAMIQDGHGQKMSKSLGNGVDPLDIIHSHGSDAMRYTLCHMTTQTQDVRMPVDMVDPFTGETFEPKYITAKNGYKVAAPTQTRNGKTFASSYGVASGEVTTSGELPAARNTSSKFDLGRNFTTKLWNATRFVLEAIGEAGPHDGRVERSIPDRWMLSRTARAVEDVDKLLAAYDFHGYAMRLYRFVWDDLCDWYIESVKHVIREPSAAGEASRRVLAAVLDTALRLLHPVMPFVTETLFEALNAAVPQRGVRGLDPAEASLLATAPWPEVDAAIVDLDAEARFERLQELVGMVRETRAATGLKPREACDVSVRIDADAAAGLTPMQGLFESLTATRVVALGPDVAKPEHAAIVTRPAADVYLHVEIDDAEEAERLEKRAAELTKQIANLDGRLSNEKYVSKAPSHLVQETRDQRASAAAELERVEAQRAALD